MAVDAAHIAAGEEDIAHPAHAAEHRLLPLVDADRTDMKLRSAAAESGEVYAAIGVTLSWADRAVAKLREPGLSALCHLACLCHQGRQEWVTQEKGSKAKDLTEA